MATRSLDIILGLRNNTARGASDAISSVKQIAMRIRNVAMAALGGVAVGLSFKQTIDEAREAEAAAATLGAALRQVGANVQTALPDLQAFASSIQSVTVHGDEAVQRLMAIGVNLGGFTGDALKSATVAAIGLAQKLGTDVNTAMELIAKAAKGNTATLSRYGIVLGDTLTPQQKFAHLLKIGAANFQQAQAQAETFNGKLAQLKNQWGDFLERLGEGVIRVGPQVIEMMSGMVRATELLAAPLASIGKDFLGGVRSALGSIGGLFTGISGAFGGFAESMQVGLFTIEFAFRNWRDLIELALTEASLFFVRFANQVEHIVKTVIDLIKWLAENWREIFNSMLSFTTAIFTNLGNNIVSFFKNLPGLISGSVDFADIWTPLIAGFEISLKSLPKIAERQKGELEKALEGQAAALGDKLFGEAGFLGFLNERLKQTGRLGEALRGAFAGVAAQFKLPDIVVPQVTGGAGAAAKRERAGGGGPSLPQLIEGRTASGIAIAAQRGGLDERIAKSSEGTERNTQKTNELLAQAVAVLSANPLTQNLVPLFPR